MCFRVRKLTPTEYGRLQAFPVDDGWEQVISDSQAYKQFGNAVTTSVVKAIALSIKNLLDSNKTDGGNVMDHQNVLALNINSEAFSGMKMDFNKILKRTLNNMEQKESEVAELTVKLKITLFKDEIPDFQVINHEATREMVRPEFTHKVSSVIQIKDEESGALRGDYELVWDRELVDYVMRPIEKSQQSIFD